MFHDSLCQFSVAQSLTGGTQLSTNVVDLGLNRNIGVGEDLYVGVIVVTAIAGTGESISVGLVGGSTSTPATAVQTLGTIAGGAAVGTTLVAKLQPNAITYRYLGIEYTVTGTVSAGAVTSFLSHDIDAFQAYASGFVVS